MSAHHEDDLPTLDATDLTTVTGGTGLDLMSMLPLIALRNANQTAAATQQPQPAQPWKPTIKVDGVEQPLTATNNGTTFTTSV
jgi:hypothetical protein